MKKYRIISTNSPAVPQIGYRATKADFRMFGVGSVFTNRIDANIFAESSASWASQFEVAMGYLVCLKKGTRWTVVDQFNSH